MLMRRYKESGRRTGTSYALKFWALTVDVLLYFHHLGTAIIKVRSRSQVRKFGATAAPFAPAPPALRIHFGPHRFTAELGPMGLLSRTAVLELPRSSCFAACEHDIQESRAIAPINCSAAYSSS